MIDAERIFDRQVRVFLVACNMLNVLIGSSRLHETSKNIDDWEFDNKDTEDAVNKVYKAYRNIDINKFENIWNANTLSDLIELIESAQAKISKAVLFVHSSKKTMKNKEEILEVLSFESDAMLDLKEELSIRIDEIEKDEED